MHTEGLDVIRVLSEQQTIDAVGVSKDTWYRLKDRGETPPLTQLSPNRVGYRVIDVKNWLDARRRQGAAA